MKTLPLYYRQLPHKGILLRELVSARAPLADTSLVNNLLLVAELTFANSSALPTSLT